MVWRSRSANPPVDRYYEAGTKAHRFWLTQTEKIFILEIGTCSHFYGLVLLLFSLHSVSLSSSYVSANTALRHGWCLQAHSDVNRSSADGG